MFPWTFRKENWCLTDNKSGASREKIHIRIEEIKIETSWKSKVPVIRKGSMTKMIVWRLARAFWRICRCLSMMAIVLDIRNPKSWHISSSHPWVDLCWVIDEYEMWKMAPISCCLSISNSVLWTIFLADKNEERSLTTLETRMIYEQWWRTTSE